MTVSLQTVLSVPENGLYVPVLCILGNGLFYRAEFRHVRQDHWVIPAQCPILAETDAPEQGIHGTGSSE